MDKKEIAEIGIGGIVAAVGGYFIYKNYVKPVSTTITPSTSTTTTSTSTTTTSTSTTTTSTSIVLSVNTTIIQKNGTIKFAAAVSPTNYSGTVELYENKNPVAEMTGSSGKYYANITLPNSGTYNCYAVVS
ncbi:hypothetical protein [Mycobacterium sp.]|uniref:hypothetical protein n=1 Tax=Mycobacterium sp. TaxID=1785 RepID=UPI0031D1F2C1